MSAAAQIYYVENDHLLTATVETMDGEAMPDMTVQVTLYRGQTQSTVVTGETWPLTMPHIGAGVYEVRLTHALGLTVGQRANAHIVGTAPGQPRFTIAMPLTVVQRTGRES